MRSFVRPQQSQTLLVIFSFIFLAGQVLPAVACQTELDRTILPIHEPAVPFYKELDARDATPPPRWQVTAPAGAPNVIVVLIDDIGFGHSSASAAHARCQRSSDSRRMASSTIAFTPRRFAVQPARLC